MSTLPGYAQRLIVLGAYKVHRWWLSAFSQQKIQEVNIDAQQIMSEASHHTHLMLLTLYDYISAAIRKPPDGYIKHVLLF